MGIVGLTDTIVVCGGRDYDDRSRIWLALDVQWLMDPAAKLVHGRCFTGADYHANGWALKRGVTIKGYPAQWDKYGRAAGPIRNGLMLETECPRLVIAFPGGDGTADCCRQARQMGVPVWEVKG